jgi:hypothetical protein
MLYSLLVARYLIRYLIGVVSRFRMLPSFNHSYRRRNEQSALNLLVDLFVISFRWRGINCKLKLIH